ncbi:LOW QUALITY PROTEIN: hypothetical protein PHMEG_00031513 [Phytophthora megakarya]|uniref:DDE Tnp4 domain-containing protein n=1 Tax=Phytophthora megakarya TaxID=4795 RepID=A0A225UXW0_9STRA|nr:LOW QUALITY PROTEIN: hypothetical protein PHMEG_00031513 [Phytophthora megakarya]
MDERFLRSCSASQPPTRRLVIIAEAPKERAECIFRRRLAWNVHKQTLLLEGQFKRCYRMDVSSFERLMLLVRPALQRYELQSARRTGTDPVSTENMLQMTISWLAGSNYHTTRGLAGTSVPGFYGYVHAVMNAICGCPELRIRSPTESKERIVELADAFTSLSKDGTMTGCVGCIDGWLCQIRAPTFFSGHYQLYGVNVQPICDAFCCFTGYCFNSPGNVGDSIAYKKWKLSHDVVKLPPGFYIVSDNAYPLSSSLLVPYNKLEIKSRKHSDYNFYLSQLRIRIEMAFGLLVNKWQIFRRPLVVDFVNVGKVIKTCMKLHNYCIDERLKLQDTASSNRDVSLSYLVRERVPETLWSNTYKTSTFNDRRAVAANGSRS